MKFARIKCTCGNKDETLFYPVDVNGNRLERLDDVGCVECACCHEILFPESALIDMKEMIFHTTFPAGKSRNGQRVRIVPFSKESAQYAEGRSRVSFWDGTTKVVLDSELIPIRCS